MIFRVKFRLKDGREISFKTNTLYQLEEAMSDEKETHFDNGKHITGKDIESVTVIRLS